ncbi:uncharacterized protein LOC127728582 [Mytilus californianus]|uniref:uncharacterized protein LOC127728582 n=1 Tax=Mytilus californianus TaxID=6549 RepID=UPI0022467403|nr:uncharacterized protein LOC127728582 [Mytilus californianus]
MDQVIGLVTVVENGVDVRRQPLFHNQKEYSVGGCNDCYIKIEHAVQNELARICVDEKDHISIIPLSPSHQLAVNFEAVGGLVTLNDNDIFTVAGGIFRLNTKAGMASGNPSEEAYISLKNVIKNIFIKKYKLKDALVCFKGWFQKCQDDHRDKLMKLTFEENSLLTLACTEGDLELVTYLIDDCNWDVNYCEGIKHPSLHSAILNGHVDIIPYLLAFGADSNLIDSMGYKPLNYAYRCLEARAFEVTKMLVLDGADINCTTVAGKGQKLEWGPFSDNRKIKFKDEEVIEIVGDPSNIYIGQDEHPLIFCALFDQFDIFSYFIERSGIPNNILCNALDVYGATCALEFKFEESLSFLKAAMELRYGDPAHKVPKENVKNPRPVYNNRNEMTCLDDFNNLANNPSSIPMMTQAVLIYERILPLYTEQYFDGLLNLTNQCVSEGHYKMAMGLHIELQKAYCNAAKERICVDKYDNCGTSIANMLTLLKNSQWIPSFEDKMLVCEQSYQTLLSNTQFNDLYYPFTDNIIFACCFASMHYIMSCLHDQNIEHKIVFYQFMKKLVNCNFRDENGNSMIHKALELQEYGFSDECSVLNSSDNTDIIQLLFQYNIDINSTSNEGNTALHSFMHFINRSEMNNEDRDMIRLLVKHGSHLDSQNKRGETVLDLLRVGKHDLYDLNLLPLQCKAASVVAKYGLLVGNEYPEAIVSIVKQHETPS